MRRIHDSLITLGLLMIALISAACTMPVARAEIVSITIKGGDHTFDAPPELPAGPVSLNFENVGHEVHHVQLVALNEGVTTEQVMAALQQGATALFPLLRGLPGGVGPLDPGKSGRVTVTLTAGNYLLLCFLQNQQGVPHLALGMVAPLTVKGEMPTNQSEPASVGTVRLINFSFVLPQAVKAGKQTWKIVNEGTQPHEITLIKLAAGKTLADLAAFNQNPQGAPPFANIGGFQGIDPRASGWLHLDLTPGTYVAMCHIPDAASGKAHHELGMMLPFTVQ